MLSISMPTEIFDKVNSENRADYVRALFSLSVLQLLPTVSSGRGGSACGIKERHYQP